MFNVLRNVGRGLPGAALALSFAVQCRADSGEESTRSWGVGWDQGIAARYRAESGWGMGLRVDLGVTDQSGDETESHLLNPEETRVVVSRDGSEFHGLDIGFMVFREVEVGRWVRLGPFAELSFVFDRWETIRETIIEEGTSFYSTDRQRRTWALEVGFRPAFAIEDRFVLETRLGVGVTRTFEDRASRRGLNGDAEDNDMNDSDSWGFRSFGQNLGLGSALKFIVYF